MMCVYIFFITLCFNFASVKLHAQTLVDEDAKSRASVRALQFNGGPQSGITVEDTEALNPNSALTSFTVEAWINIASFPTLSGEEMVFVEKHDGTYGYRVFIDDEDLKIQINTNIVPTRVKKHLTTNKWYHLAVAKSSSIVPIPYTLVFLDGIKVDSVTTSGVVTNANQAPVIAKGWNGKIDEFRFWNVFRLKQSIKLYARKQFSDYDSRLLEAYYRMDEGGNINTVFDYTINRNNAKADGFTRVMSEAGIREFSTFSTESIQEVQTTTSDSKTEFTGISKPIQLVTNSQTSSGMDSLRIVYQGTLKESMDLPPGLERLVTSIGFWEYTSLSKGSMDFPRIQFLKSSPWLTPDQLRESPNYVWVYRYSPTDTWKLLGRDIYNESAICSSEHLAELVNGYAEVAIAIKRNLIVSVKEGGKWNDPLTWNIRTVPSEEDSVIIQTTVSVDRSPKSLNIVDHLSIEKHTLTIELDQVLQVNDGFSLSNGGTIFGEGQSELIVGDDDGSAILKLPKEISQLSKLTIQRESGVSYSGNIRLDSLKLSKGSFYTEGSTIELAKGISRADDLTSKIYPGTESRLVIASVSNVSLPPWIDTLRSLEMRGLVLSLTGRLAVLDTLEMISGLIQVKEGSTLELKDEWIKQGGSKTTDNIISTGGSFNLLISQKDDLTKTMVIPTGINRLSSVTVDRKNGIKIAEANFVISDSLRLREGNLFVSKDQTITLEGVWDYKTGDLGKITQESSDSYTLIISEKSEGSANKLVFPSTQNDFSELIINRESGASLSPSLYSVEILGTLTILKGVLNVGDVNLTFNKQFTTSTSAVLNGGIVGEDFTIVISGSITDAFVLDEKVRKINRLVLRTNRGMILKGDFEVGYGGLTLTRGTLNLEDYRLAISGSILNDGGNISGGDYTIVSSGDATSPLEWPVAYNSIPHLEVSRDAGFKINSNLTITNKLSVKQGVVDIGENKIFIKGEFLADVAKPFSGNGTVIVDDNDAKNSPTMEFPAFINEIGKMVVARSSGVRLNGDLVLKDTLKLITGQFDLSDRRLKLESFLEINSGSLSKNGSLVISGSSDLFSIPSEIDTVDVLEISRSSGVELTDNIVIRNDLRIIEGSLNLYDKTLTLEGTFSDLSGSIYGEIGSSGYEIIVAGDAGQSELVFPKDLDVVNRLEITRNPAGIGASLQGDMIVIDTLLLTNAKLNRRTYTILFKYLNAKESGQIVPPLESSYAYAGSSLMFSATRSGKVRLDQEDKLAVNEVKFTIEGWINIGMESNGERDILDRHDGVYQGYRFGVNINASGHAELVLQIGAEKISSGSNAYTLNKETWYHVLVSADNKNVMFYVNGVKIAEKEHYGLTTIGVLRHAYIGGEGSRGWIGQLDEIRIWDIVKEIDDIKGDFNRILKGDEEGLLGYYRMDEFFEGNEDDKVYDYSLNKARASLMSILSSGISWVASRAPIGSISPLPIASQTLEFSGSEYTKKYSRDLRSLEMSVSLTGRDSIRVEYVLTAPIGLDVESRFSSLVTSNGYWRIQRKTFTNAITDIKFSLKKINLLFLRPNKKYLIAYRFSPSDVWKSLGRSSIDDQVLATSLAIDLYGYIEIGIIQKEDIAITRQSGDWENPSVWVDSYIPFSGDSVVVRHDVDLNSDVEIEFLNLQKSRTFSGYLAIKDNHKLKITRGINSDKTSDNGGISSFSGEVIFKSNAGTQSEFMLPAGIGSLHKVQVEKNTSLTLNSSLRVKSSLNLMDGALNLQSYDLKVSDSLNAEGDSPSIRGSGRVILEESMDILAIPKALRSVPNLEINRLGGVMLLDDFIVEGTLSVVTGTLSRSDTRNQVHGLLVKNVLPTYTTSTITPPLRLEKEASGSAVSFADLDNTITVDNNNNLRYGDAITIELWVSLGNESTDTWKSNQTILSKKTGISGYELKTGNVEGELVFEIATIRNGRISISSNSDQYSIDLGVWHHVAVTYGKDTLTMYLNGTRVDQFVAPNSGIIDHSISPLKLGSFVGAIDEVRIWKSVKTGYQIRENMHRQLNSVIYEDLVLYYRLDESEGSTVYDFSRSMLNGETKKIEWIKSEAIIGDYSDLPTASQEIEVSSLPSVFKDVQNLQFIGNTEGQGKVRVVYHDKTPASSDLSSIINDLETGVGYWEIVNTNPGKLSMHDTRLSIPLFDINLQNSLYKNRLAIIRRRSSSSPWVFVPTEVADGSLRTLNSQGWNGYWEIAIGRKKDYTTSIRKGRWGDVSTWDTKRVPLSGENVRVYHEVTLNESLSIETLEISSVDEGIGKLILDQDVELVIKDTLIMDKSSSQVSPPLLLSRQGSRIVINVDKDMDLPLYLHSINTLHLIGQEIRATADLKVEDSLIVEKGTFLASEKKLDGLVLDLSGEMSVKKEAVLDSKAFHVVLKGTKDVNWPESSKYFKSMLLDKTEGTVTLQSSVVSSGRILVRGGTLYRGEHQILASSILEEGGDISPPLLTESIAAVSALEFFPGGQLKVSDGDGVIKPRGALTVEAWVSNNLWSDNISDGFIAGRILDGKGWSLSVGGKGQIEFKVVTVRGDLVAQSSETLFSMQPREYYHVAGVYDGKVARVYINGIELGHSLPLAVEASIAYSDRDTVLYVGSLDLSTGINGVIDELRVWNVARSEEDLTRDAFSQLLGNEVGLKAYYRFDEHEGTIAYGQTVSLLNASFVDQNRVNWQHSSAKISRYNSLYNVAFERVVIPETGVGKVAEFANDFQIISDIQGLPRRIRTAEYATSPRELNEDVPIVEDIVGSKYFYITKYSSEMRVSKAKLSLPLSELEDVALGNDRRLTWVSRISSNAPWQFLGGNVKNGRLESIVAVELNGALEVAVAVRSLVNLVYKEPEFGLTPSDIIIKTEFSTGFDTKDYKYQYVVSSTKKFLPHDLIQTLFVHPEKTKKANTHTGILKIPVQTDVQKGVTVDREYYLRTVIIIRGLIVDTVGNFFNFSTATARSKLPTTKEIYLDNVELSRDGGVDIDGAGLRFKSELSSQGVQSIVVTKYYNNPVKLDPIDPVVIGENEFVSGTSRLLNFYWAIEKNNIEFSNGRLLYDIEEIYHLLKDTSDIRWYRRDGPDSPWEDVTDKTEPIITVGIIDSKNIGTIIMKRMFQTRVLSTFSEFMILSKESPPLVYGITSMKQEREILGGNINRSKIETSVVASINTGGAISSVTVSYGPDKKLADSKTATSSVIPRNARITRFQVDVKDLAPDLVYYYSGYVENRQGKVDMDTSWFYTNPIQKQGIDTLSTGLNPVKRLRSGMLLETTLSNINRQSNLLYKDDLELEHYFVSTERYLKSPTFENLPEAIAQLNPSFWTIEPVGFFRQESTVLYGKLKSFNRGLREITTAEKAINRVSIPVDDYPEGFSFDNLRWLKRSNPSSEWKDIGGVLNINNQGEMMFMSNEQDDFIGEYTIGLLNGKEMYDVVQVNDVSFEAESISGGRAKVSWLTDFESDDLIGFDLIRLEGNEEVLAASVMDNPILHANQKPSRYEFIDSKVEYGKLYEYRIMAYSKSGHIMEYDKVVTLEMPYASEGDLVYRNRLHQNYPNPFSENTVIPFEIKSNSHIRIQVFDMVGRLVAVLLDEQSEAGKGAVNFTPLSLASGIYFYRIVTNNGFTSTRKMVYIR